MDSYSKFKFEQLLRHVGHHIVCVVYGDNDNVSLECEDCCEVLFDMDNPVNDDED